LTRNTNEIPKKILPFLKDKFTALGAESIIPISSKLVVELS
jgi:hypothetical protein